MSSIGAFSAFSAFAYQMNNRVMQDAASIEEGDEDGEILVENQSGLDVELATEGEEDGDGADSVQEGSALGSQVDAWG